MNSSLSDDRRRRRPLLFAAVLLIVHGAACLSAGIVKSVTHDEIWHLPVGLRNLQEWEFGADRLNPPMTRMWSAIPLAMAGVELDPTIDGPGLGKQFVEDHPETYHRWYVWGRVFNAAWSLASGVLLTLWSNRLFGTPAALLTLLLYATCPNVIAHSSLVTPDAGLMFGFVATLFCLALWMDAVLEGERSGSGAKPFSLIPSLRWRRALLFGAALGLAQGMKFTGVLLYPLAVMTVLLFFWRRRGGEVRWRVVSGQLAAAFAVSLVILALTYGFRGLFQPLGEFPFQSGELRTVQELLSFAGWLPVPLPGDFLLGIDEQRAIMQAAHPVFLDGQWSSGGFRTYYLKTLLYKVPHVVLLLVAVSVIAPLWRPMGSRRWREMIALALPVAVLLGVASLSGMQLGVRYILPVLPLLMMLAGSAVSLAESWPRRVRLGTGVVLVVVCGLSLRFHPHHLAYFSEVAGGPKGGRHHLLDSNLDWGQDLYLVKEYVTERGLETIGLAYFGTLSPEVLGIDYTLPPSWDPAPGTYAVSVNYVMGRPHLIREPDGTWRGVDFQEFSYFRAFAPLTTLGGSIDVYRITPEEVDSWHRRGSR